LRSEESAVIEPIDAAWMTLRARLEARGRELHEEVHSYPTPIARCDEQLTKAIEDRDAAFRRLRSADDLDQMRNAVARDAWLARLCEFVTALDVAEDEAASAVRRRLLTLLGH
jgi:hypothetical protein